MLRELFARTRPHHGSAMLLAGSVWDFATLGRVDRLADDLLLTAYLAVLAGLLVIELRLQEEGAVPEWIRRRSTWVAYATQFLFGGLFSAYVVFYSRSASLGRGLLFAVALCALLVANELADHRLRGASVRLQLFFLVVTSYVLLVVPVFTGVLIGLVPAGLLAGMAVAAVLLATRPPRSTLEARELLLKPLSWSSGLLLLLVGSQRAGLIPAVPLSLRDAGAFHDLRRDTDGWHLTYEAPGLLHPWRRHDAVFHWREGERIWLFTAVFAPTGLALDVVHHWQRWDEERGWVTTDEVPYRLEGGREGGFRGYTYKDHASPGAWRVLVETPTGLTIGRVRFDVVEGDPGPTIERIY